MRPRFAVAVVLAMLVASCSVITGQGPSYTVKADFSSTTGLFPGSFVRELGIDVGTVTKVVNQGDHVQVTMSVRNKFALKPDAQAVLVADSILGERYVQFTPAWLGGPRLADGSVVPIDRTVVPVETDQVLRSLERVLTTVDPKNVAQLVDNLAAIVDKQGPKLNQLLTNASGTLSLVADKSVDLGQLTDSLASLTGALRTRSAALTSLIRDYATVSQIIADDRQAIDGTVTQLTDATGQAAGLLSTNIGGLKDDISVLTTAGQTLDRNIDSLDVGLANTPLLFGAAKNAYDPGHNWLPLNSQSSPSTASAVIAARIRDSLAGVCRRMAKKQPALANQLAACGNPNSGFFDPILNAIPGVISGLPGQTKPAGAASVRTASAAGGLTAVEVFARGLAAIPGLGALAQSQLAAAPSAGPSPGAVSTPSAGPSDPSSFDAGQFLSPRPAMPDAPRPHRGGLVHRVLDWLGGWL